MTSDKAKWAHAWESWYGYQKKIATYYIFQLLQNNDYLSVKYQDDDSYIDDIIIWFWDWVKWHLQCKKNWNLPDWNFSKPDREDILVDMYNQYIHDTNEFLEESKNIYVLVSQNKSKLVSDIKSTIKEAMSNNKLVSDALADLSKEAKELYDELFQKLNNKEFNKTVYKPQEESLISEKIIEKRKIVLSRNQYEDFRLHVNCISHDEDILNPLNNGTIVTKVWWEEKYWLLYHAIIWKFFPWDDSKDERYKNEIKKNDIETILITLNN